MFDIGYMQIGKTSNGEMNFIGATIEYFDVANKNVNEENKEEYTRNYTENIFPCVDRTICIDDYDDIVTADLIKTIQEVNEYNDITVRSRIENLINKTIDAHANRISNLTGYGWGRAGSFRPTSSDDDLNSALLRIRKSLTAEEDKKAFNLLMSNPYTDRGEMIALVLMFMVGTRNSETAALNFGDLIEMSEHPGTYYLQVYETTEQNSNILKAGGKTLNAPRNLPVMDVLAQFILQRKAFIEERITFPITNNNGEILESINEVSIACKGSDYLTRLNANDITASGKMFLKNDLEINENRVAGIAKYMMDSYGTDEFIYEKDVTVYLFRRNMATRIYTLGLSTAQIQYYMGHDIEDTYLKRSDFSDENFLYELYTLINKHPLNNSGVNCKQFDNDYMNIPNSSSERIELHLKRNESIDISIRAREKKDPITIKSSDPIKSIVYINEKSVKQQYGENTNIIKTLLKLYED